MNKLFILFFVLINLAFTNVEAQNSIDNTFRYCEYSYPRTFDPINSKDDSPNIRITALLYTGLFEQNISGNFISKIVTDHEFLPGNRIRIILKPGMLWSDGGAVTTLDVDKTMQAINKSSNQYLKTITSIFLNLNREDDYNIVFQYRKGISEKRVLEGLQFKLLPQYKLKDLPLAPKVFNNPVTFGYFNFDDNDDNIITLKVDNNFRKINNNKPGLDKVKVYVKPDRGTQYEYFKNAHSDLLLDVRPIDISQFSNNPQWEIVKRNNLSFFFFAFNLRNKTLKDKNIRKAMMYGFDRKNVLTKIYQNEGELLAGPYTSGSLYYNNEIQPYEYDSDQAILYLKNAGYIRNSSGIMVNERGEELKLSVITPGGGNNEYTARVIAQFISDMQNIGVVISIVDLDYVGYLDRLKNKRDYDIAYGEVTFDPNYDIFPLFHSSFIGEGLENFISYSNKNVDQLLSEIKNENLPFNDKKAKADELQGILMDECPYMFLWSLKKTMVYDRRVRNLQGTISSFSFYDHIDEWYIEK